MRHRILCVVIKIIIKKILSAGEHSVNSVEVMNSRPTSVTEKKGIRLIRTRARHKLVGLL